MTQLQQKIVARRSETGRRSAINATYDNARDAVVARWEAGEIDYSAMLRECDFLAVQYRHATAA